MHRSKLQPKKNPDWKMIPAFVVQAIFLAVLAAQASGQAPGDHDKSCRTGINAPDHQFAAEWKILLDSYDYQDLFANTASVWVTNDVDGDGQDWTQIGGVCSRSMRPCTRQVSQDNWLFSQHVRYEDAKEVFFQVSYRFIECQGSCIRPYVTLYHYNSDNIATDANRINPSNYELLFGDEESSRFVQPTRVSRVQEVTRTITRPANSDGFYLGFRDEGTCGTIPRLIVYYVVCPTRVDGLVTYPEFGVPERTSADIPFEAQCASNAHNITSLQVIAFSSNSSCSPVASGGAVCECDGGYVLSSDGLSCEACPAGQYRTLSGSTCEDCPANTQTDKVAASLCSCNDGFYRSTSPQEGPEKGCTEPPSKCTNLQVLSTTDTTITVSWSRPVTTGRSDYFYMVSHSDPSNLGVLITVEEELMDSGSTVTYTVTGLLPFTPYMVLVSTHNGISAQDPDNANSRQCDITTETMEGAPSEPTKVKYLCTVVVWQPPAKPNGNIIRYDIQFSTGEPKEVDGAGDSFYITTAEEQASGTTVRVRAVTGAGNGDWTVYQDVGCASGDSNSLPELYFTLGGTVYLNNTVVVVDDIGEGENALACATAKEGCCRTDSVGHFYFPNGTRLLFRHGDFSRDREDTGIVRLNRKNGATSPLGTYTCEIPDVNGILQNLTIELVPSRVRTREVCPDPTCTECPPVVPCPTTQPPTTCPECPPVVTCPTTQPPTTCTECPDVTCPTQSPTTCPNCPDVTCPTTQPCIECPDVTCPATQPPTMCPVESTSLHFVLGGTTYLNNTVVVVETIGEEENGLACVTTKEVCCRADRLGNFYFPDGMQLSSTGEGGDIYRDREDTGIVRLNRRNGATSPLGTYTCEIPDVNGVLQNLHITLVSNSTESQCPTECTVTPASCP